MARNNSKRKSPAWQTARRGLPVWFTCGSTITVAAYWMLLRFSDVTWWGTAVAFAPRWPVVIPLFLLVPLTLVLRRWWLVLINLMSTAAILFPIMGLELRGLREACPSQSGLNMRVLTCNVHGDAFDVARLNGVIAETGPDIVALQECPATIVQDCFSEDEWFTELSGELCVASRFPILSAKTLDRRSMNGWGNFALLCRIDAPEEEIAFVSVHLLSPRQGLEALRYDRFKARAWAQQEFQRRHEESKLLYRELQNVSGPSIVAGDLNMTPESSIFRKYLLKYVDAFSESGAGFGYTFSTRWHSVRVDHVLANQHWAVKCCRVCGDIGSDHLPVVAELQRADFTVDKTQ